MNKKYGLALAVVWSGFSVASASASSLQLSDFFQDWKLNAGQSSDCAQTISSLPGFDIPGANTMPGPGYDASKSIRFSIQGQHDEVLTLGKNPSRVSDGYTSVSINGNVLSVSDKKLDQTFTMESDGSLVLSTKGSETCAYANTHQDLVGKVEVGAALLVAGKKVAECKFAPASPRPDQINYVYSEACDLGKYTNRTTIDQFGIPVVDQSGNTLPNEIVANSNAPHDLVIVRSGAELNAGSENFLSQDTEIMTQKDSGPSVDDILPSNSEYFISPYETELYTIFGTNGQIQIEYAPAQ